MVSFKNEVKENVIKIKTNGHFLGQLKKNS